MPMICNEGKNNNLFLGSPILKFWKLLLLISNPLFGQFEFRK